MIQITPHMRIFLATEPVDFRKGIDGLCGLVRGVLNQDPFSGGMFIFSNRKRTTLKIILYDGQGFGMFVKRLSKGRFQWWPRSEQKSGLLNLNAAQLHLLLWNGDPSSACIGSDWRKITAG